MVDHGRCTMARLIFLLVLFAAGATAGRGSLRLEAPVFVGETDAVLQYDDGTAYWIAWEGLYRGVWFDVTDFAEAGTGFNAEFTEFWFYHLPSHSWDTSSFYAELWNGDAPVGPTYRLDQTTVIATHYAPVYANFSPTLGTESNFWVLENTIMSSSRMPSILADNSPNPTSHSYYSNNFILWEPWILGGATANDYFVRAGGDILGALDTESWGAIKGLFR
jgi:hypothetical protein